MPPKRRKKLSGQEKAQLMARVALQKKPLDPLLLDVGKNCSFADYFLILSGTSTRQAQALADHIQEALGQIGIRPLGREDGETGHWILMDYGDVIVHIFYESAREFYDLEGLWLEAPRLPITSDGAEGQVS
ncbi:MAG: ribosome silencing factor [Desulfobacca sp.]|nr:ribosome silencing factor [Desulfobacca sp.]